MPTQREILARPSTPPSQTEPVNVHTQAVKAIATGYCLHGRKTSTDKLVYPGCVALSDTLRRQLGARYGDKIMVEGVGYFVFDDRSPQKFRHIDIHFPRYKDAKIFGKKVVKVQRVG